MRIGIVGCGLIGAKRAAAAKGHEIVVVCDRDKARADALARQTGATAVTSPAEAIQSKVDAIVVATTHDQLAGIALAAVEAVSQGTSRDRYVLDTLSGLVAKSMVIAETRKGMTRLRLLETVRAYGLEKAVAGAGLDLAGYSWTRAPGLT